MLVAEFEKRLSSFTLSVSIRAEGAIAIAGPSGCGKSVTLKCIAGIMKPDSGYIEYNGHVLFDSEKHVDLPPQKRRIGYLFQNYALFPDMTVRENILAGLGWEKDRMRREEELMSAVSLLHLEHVMDSKPHELSGGEAQRTALARMIVNRPDLMLFDEPFSALDVFLREEIKAEFMEIMEGLGGDYVLVTHSMDEAYSLSSSLLIMDHGAVIRQGRTEDVFSDPESVRAARITGYRNIEKAWSDGKHLHVPSWGMTCEYSGKDAIGAAVMAGDLHVSEEGYPARIVRKIDTPDAVFLEIIIEGGTSPLWMRLPSGTELPDPLKVGLREDALKALIVD